MHSIIAPLALPPPSKLRLRTQSPIRSSSKSRRERSPTRHFVDLYRDLSPSKTLKAITASYSSPSELPEDQKKLADSIRDASASQKTFARKVAESSKLLEDWCQELETWPWSGDFEEPLGCVSGDQSDYEPSPSGIESNEQNDYGTPKSDSRGYWGCLPASRVLAYEERLEEISDDLDELDIETQKRNVLIAYPQVHPALTADDTGHTPLEADYVHLDGLTALITATLLRALPWYSRLISLANGWSCRILVLKQIPHFLGRLQSVHRELVTARGVVLTTAEPTLSNVPAAVDAMSREGFDKLKLKLGQGVSELGQQLDLMLDALEGCEETLPESWIDAVEHCELEYSHWTVEAESLVRLMEQRSIAMHYQELDGPAHAQAARSFESTSPPHSTLRDEVGCRAPTPDLPSTEMLEARGDDQRVASTGASASSFPTNDFRADLSSQASRHVEYDASSFLRSTGRAPYSPLEEDIPWYSSDVGHSSASSIASSREGSTASAFIEAEHETSNDSATLALNTPPRPSSLDDASDGETPSIVSDLPQPSRFFMADQSSDEADRPTRGMSKDVSLTMDEQLDRQISSILSTVPVRINFSNPDKATGKAILSHSRPDSESALSLASAIPLAEVDPVLTLAPAYAKEGRITRSNSSSDIKLYYLTQPGKEKPIKLFIRLIGDREERVMVRVGGGWADLGQYLREYVSHHGRVVTEPSRATSQLKVHGDTSTSTVNAPCGVSDSIVSSSVPFDAGDGVRPASRHTRGIDEDGLGLAGPGSKKSDMSVEKQRWVDEMLDRARRVSSGESRKGKRNSSGDFAELGKAGQTRRLFSKTTSMGD